MGALNSRCCWGEVPVDEKLDLATGDAPDTVMDSIGQQDQGQEGLGTRQP